MENRLYDIAAYDFAFDRELIAKYPHSPRDESRLMVIDRKSGDISELCFKELVDIVGAGDRLIFNNTKVIPARLCGWREGGGKAEIFLLEQREGDVWEVMAKPGKRLKCGATVTFSDSFRCEVLDSGEAAIRRVRFEYSGTFDKTLQEHGKMPLPHYMKREAVDSIDKESYQTVYASESGAVAAPTAGLHFTEGVLGRLRAKGVDLQYVTLHVGAGTFKPVEVSDLRNHTMHSERCIIGGETAAALNRREGIGREIAVGTTSCRLLETAADSFGALRAGSFESEIFIYPGYRFKRVEALLTNFHLPKSTLLMLVSAFAGYELTMEAYRKAVLERYRFFSYGDAMLIL